MKYKIGDLEVEAVRWNGDTKLDVQEFLSDLGYYSAYINSNGDLAAEIFYDKKLQNVCNGNYLKINDYLIKSKDSLFTLSEQDFNKIATKVEEPKFKVGDKVYSIDGDKRRFIIESAYVERCEHQVFYHLDDGCTLRELELFTLEEAIEKLKEL